MKSVLAGLGVAGLLLGAASGAEARCSPIIGLTVFFPAGQASCESSRFETCNEFHRLLDRSAEVWRAGGGAVRLTGHSDTMGSAEEAQSLSQFRAAYVRDQLALRGVALEQIDIVGRGDADLRRPTADEVADPANNRVEIDMRDAYREVDRLAQVERGRARAAALAAGLPPPPLPPC